MTVGHHSSMSACWDFLLSLFPSTCVGLAPDPGPALSSSDVALTATLHLVVHGERGTSILCPQGPELMAGGPTQDLIQELSHPVSLLLGCSVRSLGMVVPAGGVVKYP